MFSVDQEVVALKNLSGDGFQTIIKNEIYKVTETNFCPKCSRQYIRINSGEIGDFDFSLSDTGSCTKCNGLVKHYNKTWRSANSFAPVMDISELEEVINEENLVEV